MSLATARPISSSSSSSSSSTFKIPHIRITEPQVMPSQDPFSPNTLGVDRPRYVKHKHYYMQEGDIILLVENTLFKVDFATFHSHSQTIREFVPLPPPGQPPSVGYTDKRPLVIREVSVQPFVQLLSIIFPIDAVRPPSTVDEFLAVLKLASGLQMETVRNIVAQELSDLDMDPVRMIVAWDEFNLNPEFLDQAYVELCQRQESLTLRETTQLGLRRFTDLAACREFYKERVKYAGQKKSMSEDERWDIAYELVSGVFLRPKSLATLGKQTV